jgi:two-component system, OmpR family, sensor histidine kinase KdpD
MKVDDRPDPDQLLEQIRNAEAKKRKGRLKIFFGMCAGVGKTYSMLLLAQKNKKDGLDVIVGYIETHDRAETAQLLNGLEIVPRKKYAYKGIVLEEMDLDAILKRMPAIVLVDELAHTNVPGSRHLKRYQDINEIIENGIDVYTTLNIQHLESRAGTVQEITGIRINETVPDSILENADEIELIDITPDDLLQRFAEGKIYIPQNATLAAENFFRKGNIHALREMALRLTAERVDMDMLDYMRSKNILNTWKTTEKLMVAVGSSPTSEKLIRWTRRMAFTLGAQWFAVSIDMGKKLSEKTRKLLSANLELAKDLGAKIIYSVDLDVVEGLLRIALENNVTQIVIGKTNEHPVKNLFSGGSLVDRLIKKSGSIDIYVVNPDYEGKTKDKFRFHFSSVSGLNEYIIAFLSISVTASLCFPITYLIGYQTVGLILLLVVAGLSLFLGRGPILFAAVLNFIIWNYLFIPPLFTFQIHTFHDAVTLFANFFIALVGGTLISRIRRNQTVLRKSQDNISILYSFLESLNQAASIKDVVSRTRRELKKYFQADALVYLKEKNQYQLSNKPFGNNTLFSEKEFAVASWVFENSEIAGRFSNTLPESALSYFPLLVPRGIIGVIGVQYDNGTEPAPDQLLLLRSFLIQISSSLDREITIDLAKQNLVYHESEKLFQTVLSTVSHELKTPIAIISSSISNLNDERTAENPDIRKQICTELKTASVRLNHLVENILDMSRIETGHLKLNLQHCEISDLIGIAFNELKEELKNRRINITIEENLPLIRADINLLKQALVNILHNSAIHTLPDGEISVNAGLFTYDKIFIQIDDQGSGVPEETLGRLFEKFYRVPGSKSGGTGLGLTIAKALVEIHGGKIFARNRVEGGLRISILLNIN